MRRLVGTDARPQAGRQFKAVQRKDTAVKIKSLATEFYTNPVMVHSERNRIAFIPGRYSGIRYFAQKVGVK